MDNLPRMPVIHALRILQRFLLSSLGNLKSLKSSPFRVNNITHVTKAPQPQLCHQDSAEFITCHVSWCCTENYQPVNASVAVGILFACCSIDLTEFEDGTLTSFTDYLSPVIPHDNVTPRTIRRFYSIPDNTFATAPNNSQAVAEFQNNFSFKGTLLFLPTEPQIWSNI